METIWPKGCVVIGCRAVCPVCDLWGTIYRVDAWIHCAKCCPIHGAEDTAGADMPSPHLC